MEISNDVQQWRGRVPEDAGAYSVQADYYIGIAARLLDRNLGDKVERLSLENNGVHLQDNEDPRGKIDALGESFGSALAMLREGGATGRELNECGREIEIWQADSVKLATKLTHMLIHRRHERLCGLIDSEESQLPAKALDVLREAQKCSAKAVELIERDFSQLSGRAPGK